MDLYRMVVDLPYDEQPVNLKQGYSAGMGAWELDHVGDNPMTWNHLSVSGRQKNKPEYLSEFELAHELADMIQARYKRKRLNRQVRIERVTQGSLSVFQHKKAISAAQANDAKAREILKI